jgi:hypothetical protein
MNRIGGVMVSVIASSAVDIPLHLVLNEINIQVEDIHNGLENVKLIVHIDLCYKILQCQIHTKLEVYGELLIYFP